MQPVHHVLAADMAPHNAKFPLNAVGHALEKKVIPAAQLQFNHSLLVILDSNLLPVLTDMSNETTKDQSTKISQ